MDSDDEFSFPGVSNSDSEDESIDDPIQRAQKENGKYLPDSKLVEVIFALCSDLLV